MSQHRDMTAGMLTELSAAAIRPALLVQVEFDSGSARFWSGHGTLSWDGHNWTGAGTLLSVSPPVEDTQIKANGARVKLNGLNAAVVALALGEARQNRIFRLYLAMLDSSEAVIADPYLLFDGLTDQFEIEDGPESGSVEAAGESYLIRMGRTRARRYTKQDQQAEYPGDLGLNYVIQLANWHGEWADGKRAFHHAQTFRG